MNPLKEKVVPRISEFLNSLRSTASEAAQAIRQRKAALLVGLLKEGSPLESVVNSIASALFWFLALAPVLLVPVYYLLLSLK